MSLGGRFEELAGRGGVADGRFLVESELGCDVEGDRVVELAVEAETSEGCGDGGAAPPWPEGADCGTVAVAIAPASSPGDSGPMTVWRCSPTLIPAVGLRKTASFLLAKANSDLSPPRVLGRA